MRALLRAADGEALRYTDEFDDPGKLLALITKMGFKGIVEGWAAVVSRNNAGCVEVKAQGSE